MMPTSWSPAERETLLSCCCFKWSTVALEVLSSFPRQSMWHLCWTKLGCERFDAENFCFFSNAAYSFVVRGWYGRLQHQGTCFHLTPSTCSTTCEIRIS
jgi:hypothetical protein